MFYLFLNKCNAIRIFLNVFNSGNNEFINVRFGLFKKNYVIYWITISEHIYAYLNLIFYVS